VGIYAGNGMMWDSPHTGSSTGLRAIYSGASYGRP
jgi:cell wall-associated NlpC family hydrolase